MPAAPPSGDEASLFFVGNATVLIRCAGLTVLTDPNFIHAGEQLDVAKGVHTTRLVDPAIAIEDLPPLDAVVLSHFHADHFDRVAQERLDRATRIVTTPHAAAELRGNGFTNVDGLDTWESRTLRAGDAELRVTATPARHGPVGVAALLPPTMGSVMEFFGAGQPVLRLYQSGDTMPYDGLREIRARHPDLDLGLLHLGGTRVFGVTVTMTGADGVEAIDMVGPRLAAPIHYDDYDVFKSPLDDFVRAVEGAGLVDRVIYLVRGEWVGVTGVSGGG